MDHDGPLVLTASIPDRIELGIINRHDLAVFVLVAQAECLGDLESPGTHLEAVFQPFHFMLGPALVIDAIEVHEGECSEATGMSLIERRQCFLQSISTATIQI